MADTDFKTTTGKGGETHQQAGGAGDELCGRVRLGITNAIGLTPRDVVIVDTGAIPKAANGKMRRLGARDAYARGELGS